MSVCEVGFMGLKKTLLLSIFMIILLSSFHSENVIAAAKIEAIEGPTFYLYEFSEKPAIYRYYINLTLKNSGDENSESIKIRIYENDQPTLAPIEMVDPVIIPSGDSLDVNFDWVTSSAFIPIEIRWFPSDLNAKADDTNSGIISLEINAFSNDENGSPGFELLFAIFAIIISTVIIRKRKRLKN
jgi:hypothetical protein